MTETQNVSIEDRLFGALAYLWIVSVVLFVLKRDSSFVQFHAKQGLVLFILSSLLWAIPGLGWFLNLVVFLAVFLGFFQAWSGRMWRMPFVGTIVERLKI